MLDSIADPSCREGPNWPQLLKPGPQGCNQVAGSFAEQIARVYDPRPRPSSGRRLERLLGTLKSCQAEIREALGQSPGDQEGGR
jgi:hypothetical protein